MNGGLPKISEEWIAGAEGASGTKMFDFLYDNCKKVQGGVSKYVYSLCGFNG